MKNRIMNVYDLIYVQLQLSLFRNEPVSQYSERNVNSLVVKHYVESKKKDNLAYGFLKSEYPLNVKNLQIIFEKETYIIKLQNVVGQLLFISTCAYQIINLPLIPLPGL